MAKALRKTLRDRSIRRTVCGWRVRMEEGFCRKSAETSSNGQSVKKSSLKTARGKFEENAKRRRKEGGATNV